MRRVLSLPGSLATLCLVSLLAAPANAQNLVSYFTLGNFTQSTPLSSGGITVSSSGLLSLSTSSGLGIAGGAQSQIIDNGESALFTFTNGPATNVNVYVGVAYRLPGSAASTLEAFGAGGNSLGVFTYYSESDPGFFGFSDLSGRVGGAAISAFRITGGKDSGGNVSSIRYTTVVSAAPEPGEYAVMGMAGLTVCGLMLHARRRKVSMGIAV